MEASEAQQIVERRTAEKGLKPQHDVSGSRTDEVPLVIQEAAPKNPAATDESPVAEKIDEMVAAEPVTDFNPDNPLRPNRQPNPEFNPNNAPSNITAIPTNAMHEELSTVQEAQTAQSSPPAAGASNANQNPQSDNPTAV